MIESVSALSSRWRTSVVCMILAQAARGLRSPGARILGSFSGVQLAPRFCRGRPVPPRVAVAAHDGDEGRMSSLKNKRSVLNEMSQKNGIAAPEYKEVLRTGPIHEPKFQYTVAFGGVEARGGSQSTKSLAMEAAAQAWYEGNGGLGPSNPRSLEEAVAETSQKDEADLAQTGTLVLVDLDNMPKCLLSLDSFMRETEDHGVCEVIAYSSMSYNPSHPMPAYVEYRRANSMDRDAADILMVFETGLMLTELIAPHRRVKSVVVVSKDHFATRLKEILQSKGVDAHHVCNYQDLGSVLGLAAGSWRS